MCLIDILPTNNEGVAKKLQEEEVRFKLKIDEEGRTNESLAKKLQEEVNKASQKVNPKKNNNG